MMGHETLNMSINNGQQKKEKRQIKVETDCSIIVQWCCSLFRCGSGDEEKESNVQMAARQQPISGTGTQYHPLAESLFGRSGRRTSGEQLHDRIALEAGLQAARDRHKQRQEAKRDGSNKAQATSLRKS